jgi:hypothetical protein
MIAEEAPLCLLYTYQFFHTEICIGKESNPAHPAGLQLYPKDDQSDHLGR